MTPCSAAACGIFSSRESSRSTCVRTCSGSSSSLSVDRSSSTSASAGSCSPSSSWIAFICWRRTHSRWPFSISALTWLWIFEPMATMSSSRARISRQPAQALADVDLLEQRLALLAADPQRAGDQVAERGRVVEVDDRHLQLLGQVRDLLDDLAERLLDVAHQRGQLRALLDHVGQLLDARGEVRRGPQPLLDPHPLAALDEDPQRAVGHLEHARDDAGDADVVELLGARRVDLGLLAGQHDEHAVADQHVVDEPDASGPGRPPAASGCRGR